MAAIEEAKRKFKASFCFGVALFVRFLSAHKAAPWGLFSNDKREKLLLFFLHIYSWIWMNMVPKRKKFWYIFLLKKGQKSPSNLVIARVWGMCTKCTKKFSILVQISLFLPFFRLFANFVKIVSISWGHNSVRWCHFSKSIREGQRGGIRGIFRVFSEKRETRECSYMRLKWDCVPKVPNRFEILVRLKPSHCKAYKDLYQMYHIFLNNLIE